MDQIQTRGHIPLGGEVTIQGSKNAALPLMAAALLHPGRTVLYHCPRILDVEYMGMILKKLGCAVTWERQALVIDAREACNFRVPSFPATRFRASVLLLGSLLGRFGSARLPYPGGCTIGLRPIDLHLRLFEQMGAAMEQTPDEIRLFTKEGKRLQGCETEFAFPSVGATENAIIGAVKAKGVTVLKGCATEPEIAELCRFLNEKGAKIEGVGSEVLTVTGTEELHDSEYTLMSDRIVAGTYMLAVAGTGGSALLRGAPWEQMDMLIRMLKKNGVRICAQPDSVRIDASAAHLQAADIQTAPYPGFPTDLQSQMMVLLCGADGESRLEETLFESRFLIAKELVKMGADIRIEGRVAKIRGVRGLSGAAVNAKELRGGAALVTAGLLASGRTVISGSRFIRRGYEDICRDFSELGADIQEI